MKKKLEEIIRKLFGTKKYVFDGDRVVEMINYEGTVRIVTYNNDSFVYDKSKNVFINKNDSLIDVNGYSYKYDEELSGEIVNSLKSNIKVFVNKNLSDFKFYKETF